MEYMAGHDYYPAWVCSSCGAKYGRRRCGTACWHVGTCGICGIEASVTEPRDFGHLQTGWRERCEQEASNPAISGGGYSEQEARDYHNKTRCELSYIQDTSADSESWKESMNKISNRPMQNSYYYEL